MKRLRIGLVDLASAGWSAGGTFTRMLAHSMKAAAQDAEDVELTLLFKKQAPAGIDLPGLPLQPPRHFPGEVTWRKLTDAPNKSGFSETARAHGLDVILPIITLPEPIREAATIGWIPDFQDRRLPQFFPPAELKKRAGRAAQLAASSTRVLLSSQDALKDFEEVAPTERSKARVVPFPSLFAFDPPAAAAGNAVEKYRLPEKFALVANQFWTHKNHLLVVEAVRRARAMGTDIPLVMTGLPSDHRDPSNSTVSALLQAIAVAGLHDRIFVLGQVPFPDLIDLLRRAAVVIQPSRFEGWSTSVQDAKAIGRPLLCSELAVHREQAPEARGFFDLDDAKSLASILVDSWSALRPGPDLAAESAGLERERAFAAAHGRQVLELCREAARAHAER